MNESKIQLAKLVEISVEAGELIKNIYKSKRLKVYTKTDNSPVTEADLKSSDFLIKALGKISSDPVISEEDKEKTHTGHLNSYWMIDPLDGTKEFIDGSDEFCLNIAYLRDHIPVLGVIYAPMSSEAYYGSKYEGVFKSIGLAKPAAICVRPLPDKPVFIQSRRHGKLDQIARLGQSAKCCVENLGSALKFGRIAEGKADYYLRYGPTHEWDTAAGQCIVELAGGSVNTLEGQTLSYGKSKFVNPEFIACSNPQIKVKEFVSNLKNCY